MTRQMVSYLYFERQRKIFVHSSNARNTQGSARPKHNPRLKWVAGIQDLSLMTPRVFTTKKLEVEPGLEPKYSKIRLGYPKHCHNYCTNTPSPKALANFEGNVSQSNRVSMEPEPQLFTFTGCQLGVQLPKETNWRNDFLNDFWFNWLITFAVYTLSGYFQSYVAKIVHF